MSGPLPFFQRAFTLALLAGFSLAAFAVRAGAQEIAAATLSELSVEGTGSGSLTVPSVSAQRAAVNATVGSVAFVDAKDFQDRYANTLRDTLKEVPGVYVQERY
jgi:iron complex outermembrane receptor protein